MSKKQVEGQYGDYRGLKVGAEIAATIVGVVVEVGINYAVLETEDGDEIQVNQDWELELSV